MLKQKQQVMVAMSGGVDSSVTAALLLEAGHEVSGVTMCFELPPAAVIDGEPARPSCCGLESIEDARRVCRTLGIRHHVLNYGDALEELVIKNFIEEYGRGRTPNPCVRCNQLLKFERLLRDARALGATHLATGHYVASRFNAATRMWELCRAKDPRKDQSYFLYGIPREALPLLLFPLGEYAKDEVRSHARRLGLPVAEKKDSQDICFIPNGKYQEFLSSRAVASDRPGAIVDHTGKRVGEHRGLSHYTVGQREGLGIALGMPVYVNRIDPSENVLHVGPKERLFSAGLDASGLNLVSMNFSQETFEAFIKIRYNQKDIKGDVLLMPEGRMRVRFHEPQSAVTPGQSVVFYHQDVLLGGAVIDQSIEAF